MGTCFIFCAGEFSGLFSRITPDDYIIAADGGLVHTRSLALKPNAILGDFDSLGYVPEGSTVFPVEKDDTDAMLAVKHGLALGYRDFMLYGCLEGPRIDHTLANFQALLYLTEQGATGTLVGKTQLVTALHNGTMEFPALRNGLVSVFCMGADAKGVTIRGLQYPLKNATLQANFPLGVSNHFIGKKASISVAEGSLLIVCDRPIW